MRSSTVRTTMSQGAPDETLGVVRGTRRPDRSTIGIWSPTTSIPVFKGGWGGLSRLFTIGVDVPVCSAVGSVLRHCSHCSRFLFMNSRRFQLTEVPPTVPNVKPPSSDCRMTMKR